MSREDLQLPRWGQTLTDAAVCSLLLVFGEAVTVTLFRQEQLVGGWEARQGLRHLVLIAWELAVPIAWLGGATARSIQARPKQTRWATTVGAALYGGASAIGVSGGRHFENVALRGTFSIAVGAAGALVVWAAFPIVRRGVVARPTLVGVMSLVLVVAIATLNTVVLPGLYPAFHVALALVAVFTAPFVALLWSESSASRSIASRVYAGAFFVPIALSALVPWAARKLSASDNVRFVYSTHTLTLAPAIEIAMKIAPPKDLDEPAINPSLTTSPARALNWEGRDVVLISVDALRADHVGAYGYKRATTPNIDALAATGVRFDQAFCATPHTSYSVTSMLTGKYMRPLLLQGVGGDSDTLAGLLRTYGYRTAAFYPPAVFFIDGPRFKTFEERYLDFEYRRIEFADAPLRAEQVERYVAKSAPDRKLFLWVHLFEPHEPYVRHEGVSFGDRDVDLYDGEVATSDAGVGKIVSAVRARRPQAIVIITADHGEEFGEHGGRYHGTSVYDEQVRVPLIIDAPGSVVPHVVKEAVQTIDIMPTVLSSLGIPRPARVRGNDLGPLLASDAAEPQPREAFAETDEATLVARRALRLVCARRAAACQLFDTEKDPSQSRDVSAQQPDEFVSMKRDLRALAGSHGKFEAMGRRADGKEIPEALRRGLAGDGDATLDVAALLDDADVIFRRRAAEVLFDLARPESAAALRLALTRDEDDVVKRWAALALTRMGQGAMRVVEMLDDPDLEWRRLAALALGEAGDRRGEDVLVAWWNSRTAPFHRAKSIVAALGKLRSKNAVVPLIRGLDDLRLRPYVAQALAAIGEGAARPALLEAFAHERYVPTRVALGTALIDLGAQAEMAPALTRFLGTPDPLPGGVAIATRGKFLASIGGPDGKDLASLTRPRTTTVGLDLIIPRAATDGHDARCRVIARGRSRSGAPRTIRIGKVALAPMSRDGRRDTSTTELDRTAMVELVLPATESETEVAADVPASVGVGPGRGVRIAIERTEDVDISALAIVPLVDDLPPPPPEPWTPPSGSNDGDESP